MTITEPLPDLQWGKGTWQDYISNWRTRDTNWMQERLILRYQSTALRNAAWAAPSAGQVTYNDETKTLEMWRASQSAWVRSLMFQYLVSSQDTAAGTNIFHASSGAKGITLGPTSLLVDTPTTNFLSGTALIDATGLTLKVGTKTVKLSTDTANLVSDSPIKAPSLDVSAGTGTVINAAGKTVSVGTLNASAGSITNLATGTVTGTTGSFTGTITGGVLNGTNGTIGGVALGSNSATASAGFVSQNGWFRGDTNGVILSRSGASMPSIVAQSDYVRIRSTAGIPYDKTDATWPGAWIGIVYTADPGAANAPPGSILFL